ncbi:MAG: hypothetical protein LBU37_07975 [Tannerellaceae bacterium]|jgi:hypothetical protein|nr:hypothetical protein [Tannerellaceae bacterium]
MKFRLFVLVAFLSCSALNGKAQVYTGGSFTILDNSGSTFIHIAPEIGVKLNDKFALGGNVAYYNIEGASYFSVAPYARLTFVKLGLLSLFADGSVDLFWSDPGLNFGAGITPGVLIDTNTRFSFFAKCGYLGYSDTPVNPNSGVSLSSTNLNIGFHYNF